MPAGVGSRLTSLVLRVSPIQLNPPCPTTNVRRQAIADVPSGSYTIVDNGGTLVVNIGDGVFSIEKTAATSAYDSAAVGTVGIPGDFVLRIKPTVYTNDFLIGMNSDPLADNNYASIDYAFNMNGLAVASIYESGGSISVGNVLSTYYWIWRSGSSLNYGTGATLAAAQVSPFRTVTDSNTLYFDSAIFAQGSAAEVLLYDLVNTVYNVTVQGQSTPSPSLVRSMVKSLQGSSIPAPRLVRQSGKPLLVASTPSPALVRQVSRLLRTTSTPVPTIARSTAKTQRTASTPVPSLARSTIFARSLLTASTPAPSLRRDTAKLLRGQSTPAPALSRAMAKAVRVETTPVPLVSRMIAKTLGVITTPAPSLASNRYYTKTLQAVTGGVASGSMGSPRVAVFFRR